MNISLKLSQVLIFLYTTSVLLLPPFGYGPYVTLLIIPFGFVITFGLNLPMTKIVFAKSIIKFKILFLIFTIISNLWVIDISLGIEAASKQLISLLFGLNIFLISIKDKKNIEPILWSFFASSLVLMINLYTISDNLEYETQRVNNTDVMGSNTYGYFIMMGLAAIFIIKESKPNKILIHIAIASFITISYYIIVITASRSALIINTIGIILYSLLSFIPYKKNKVRYTIIAIILFVTIAFISIQYFINTLYTDSFLSYRMQMESTRVYHFFKAIEIGFDNFFLGVGSGNYAAVYKPIEWGSFSHNSFTEVFANLGIIGLILYSLIQYQTIKLSFRLVKNKYVKFSFKNIIFLCIILYQLYSLNYVVYLTPFFEGFVMTIIALILHIDISYDRKNIIYSNAKR